MQLGYVSGVRLSGCSRHLQLTSKIAPACTAVVRARKQAERQQDTTITPEHTGARPAQDLPEYDNIARLSKAKLQQELQARGLEHQGKKDELASRLLDSLIAQQSAISAAPSANGEAQAQLHTPPAPARRGRRTSRKATSSADPIPAAATEPHTPTADATAAAAYESGKTRKPRKPSRRVSSVLSEEQQQDAAVPASTVAAAADQGQQGEAPGAAVVQASKRGRRTSRKSAVIDAAPIVEANEVQPAGELTAAAVEEAPAGKASKRGRRTSRKSTVADPAPAAVESIEPVQLPAIAAATAVGKRSGRRTSRKSSMADPTADQPAVSAEANAAVHTPVEDAAAGSAVSKRVGRRSSRKSAMVDPAVPKAAADAPAAPASSVTDAAVDKSGRGRKASRKSSVLEPESVAGAASGEAVAAAVPAAVQRRSRTKSSAKTTSTAPTNEPAAAPSRAKLLARSLAKKEIATHTAAGAVAAAAALTAAPVIEPATADPVEPDVAAAAAATVVDIAAAWGTDQLYAGSQAQSDNLLLGSKGSQADSSVSDINLSYDEVIAQLTAEGVAGLTDEPQLATASFDLPSMAAAATTTPAESSDSAATAALDVVIAAPAVQQRPNLNDIAAAVEEPLQPAAEAAPLIVDESPDVALTAFDHLTVDPPAEANAGAALQQPSLLEIAAAPAEPADIELLGEDEAADAALSAFDHLAVEPPAADNAAAVLQKPSLVDIAAAVQEDQREAVLEEDESPDVVLGAFDHLAIEPPAAANAGAALQQPNLLDIAAAVHEEQQEAVLEEDESADDVLSKFDQLAIEPPAAANAGAALQALSLVDIAAATEPADSSFGEDESADEALSAFDQLAVEPPAAANAGAALQALSLVDIAAAAEPADSSFGEDESADEALSAFDQLAVEPPAVANAGAALQTPSLVDITAAAEPADSSLGEDEEADVVLGQFDHIDFPAATTPTTAAAVTAAQPAAVASQVAASAVEGDGLPVVSAVADSKASDNGTGSMQDEAVTAVAVAPVEPTAAVEAAAVKTPEHKTVPAAASSFAGQSSDNGLGGMLQNWVAAVMKLFDDWQRSLNK